MIGCSKMSNLGDTMFVLICLALSACVSLAAECDRLFASNPSGPKNGTFSSSTITQSNKKHISCMYTFIGGPNERVKVTFTTFNLKGTTPECRYEYIDIFSELDKPETDIIVNGTLSGRYCGHVPPRTHISLYRTLVLAYNSNSETIIGKFEGTYEFIDASIYSFGTQIPPSICSHIIRSIHKRHGELLSPTYPGTYPKNILCAYKFFGTPGQRVKLEFFDFDLFAGGLHCPYDYVRFYDGSTNQANIIKTYCGVQRNLVVFSSHENLLMEFKTRKTELENRGFKAKWEFSEKFVKLDFINDKYAYHIKGTECDQRVTSRGETSGTIYSPNFPFPYLSFIKCHYYIDGLKDQQHLEKVILNFKVFQIPSTGQNCSNGMLSAYLDVKDEEAELGQPDKLLCGSHLPPEIVSTGARLILVFTSGEIPAQGFKATYQFVKDYGVQGIPHPDGSCYFSYDRNDSLTGILNSPRHPSNYPMNLTCIYVIKGWGQDQISLYFDLFLIAPEPGMNDPPLYGSLCGEDYISIYNVYPNHTNISEKLIGQYCGKSCPGPIRSEVGANMLKIVFHSDGTIRDGNPSVLSGFRARYTFSSATLPTESCGQNISHLNSGVITSTNFPQEYPNNQHCEWFIQVKRYQKILLQFVKFLVEGNQKERGCSVAVLRIYTNLQAAPFELCGEKKEEALETHYLSDENIIRISFLTSDKSVGAQGFQISWTAIRKDVECLDDFKCNNNSFCISKTLRCNNLPNCGQSDKSDEETCGGSPGISVTLIVGLTAGTGFLCIIVTIIVCHRKCKRRREREQREANKSRVRESTVHYRPTTLEV